MRSGTTLIELTLTLSIIAMAAAISISGFARLLDGIAVRGAASEVHTLFSVARHAAINRGKAVTVELDTTRHRVLVRSVAETLRTRELGTVHGVRLAATRTTSTYSANGLGYGTSNLTLVIRRGRAADTLTVSRLGRVKR